MVITVHCPECASAFPVDTKKIPEKGVNARCSTCSHVFRVERPAEEMALVPPTPPPAAPEPVVDEEPHFGAAAVEKAEEESPELGGVDVGDEAPSSLEPGFAAAPEPVIEPPVAEEPEAEHGEALAGEGADAPGTEVEQAPGAEMEEAPEVEVEEPPDSEAEMPPEDGEDEVREIPERVETDEGHVSHQEAPYSLDPGVAAAPEPVIEPPETPEPAEEEEVPPEAGAEAPWPELGTEEAPEVVEEEVPPEAGAEAPWPDIEAEETSEVVEEEVLPEAEVEKPWPDIEAEEAPGVEPEALPEAEPEEPWPDIEAEETPEIEAELLPEAEAEAPSMVDDTSEWVFETETEIDLDSLEIEPLETLQSSLSEPEEGPHPEQSVGFEIEETTLEEPPSMAFEEGQDIDAELDLEPTSFDQTSFEDVETPQPEAEAALPESPAPETLEAEAPEQPEQDAWTVEPEPAPEPPEPEPATTPPDVGGFTFGKRDPKEKARRLARVLVSDMIMYNPDRHERALAGGTLKEDFADEITKSWKEYVDQVGEDTARGNSFWTDALNEILARGEQVF